MIENSRSEGMPPKRSADGAPKDIATSSSLSPVMSAFTYFRSELDEHHDRRERIVKASRDITAQSKKIIFSLQRHRLLGRPLSAGIASDVSTRKAEIQRLLTSLIPDLAPSTTDSSSSSSTSSLSPTPSATATTQASTLRQQRYLRQLSPGLQELVEAAVFERYLVTQTLLSLEEVRTTLLPEPLRPVLAEADYLLGVYDATGEIMRFAITGMATGGSVPAGVDGGGGGSDEKDGPPHGGSRDGAAAAVFRRNVLTDLRELRAALEGLDVRAAAGPLAKECDRKAEVMRQSVDKVEAAVYGLIVRGKERPKGWLPDAKAEGSKEMEGY